MLEIGKVHVRGKISTRDGNLTRAANAALAEALGPLLPNWRSAVWEETSPGTHKLAEVYLSIGETEVTLINSELRTFRDAFPA